MNVKVVTCLFSPKKNPVNSLYTIVQAVSQAIQINIRRYRYSANFSRVRSL